MNGEIIAQGTETYPDRRLRSDLAAEVLFAIHRHLAHHVPHGDTQVTEIADQIYRPRQAERMETVQESRCYHHRWRRDPDRRESQFLSISIDLHPPLLVQEDPPIPHGLNPGAEKEYQQIIIQTASQ